MTYITDEQLGRYREDGYVLLPSLFAPDEVEAMKAELPGIYAEDTPARVLEKGTGVVRSVYGSHRGNETFARLVRDPRLLEAARRIVDDEVYVHQFKVNAKLAFRGEVCEWHQDYIFWRNEDGMPTSRVVTLALFLDEVNHFNGPLLFVPGSHRGGVIEPRGRKAQTSMEPSWKADVAAALSYTVEQDTLAEPGRDRGPHRRARVGALLRRQRGARLRAQNVALRPRAGAGDVQRRQQRAAPAREPAPGVPLQPRLHPAGRTEAFVRFRGVQADPRAVPA